MVDVVDPLTRSRMMAGVRGKNTHPELIVRSLLHRRGFRFRIHVRGLPGTPDVVLPRYRAVANVMGCFWHGHECATFRWPASRPEFWREKILSNRARDEQNLLELSSTGWRVATIWECSITGSRAWPSARLIDTMAEWLQGEVPALTIGTKPDE